MWLPRLGHKNDIASTCSLFRILALRTQLSCCKEAQTNSHGEVNMESRHGPQ